MRASVIGAAVATVLLLALTGCDNAGENRIAAFGATGEVRGFVAVDANGSRLLDTGDDSLPGIKVRLHVSGGTDTGLVQTTQPNGFYRFRDVPVGIYRLQVDTSTFSDTLLLVKVDSTTFSILPGDTTTINALAGLPLVTVQAMRALAPGRRVFLAGVALSGATSFSDSIAAFADTSGAVALVRVRAGFVVGDSLRVRGTTAVRRGQPVLSDPTTFPVGQGVVPTAPTLSTAGAAGAAAGNRDAELIRVAGAVISDTVRVTTGFVLTVNDGSGPLEVELDRAADQAFQPGSLPGSYLPGSTFDILGVLVPTGAAGVWRLRPRSAADLTVIPPPVLTIAEARALPAGRIVEVVGVALTASGSFADSTIHLADTSGAIRLTRPRFTATVADSIRVRGITGSRNGEPTLDGATSTSLGRGFLPTASTVTTQVAAAAAGGTLDAQMVIVRGAIVSDTLRTSTSFILTVSDSSGPLEVQLDRTADPAFQPANLPGTYVPGNKFDVVGVLARTAAGPWRLKPRSAGDLTDIPLPVVSIATARTLPAGQTVVVVGVALNGSLAFADSTVHLVDTSGAIRLTRLRTSVAAGDSVRVRAVTASRDGQPTLDGGSSTSLGRGLFPTAVALTTLEAAGASAGSLDAHLVVVHGAIVSDTARTSTSFILTVSDSSGPLEVQLDRTADAAFQPGSLPGVYIPGNKFDVLGVLGRTATGTWRLKPRSATDLTQIPLPVVSIAAARALPPGQIVVVVGVALNSTGVFSDTTVHLADTSGAVRLTRMRTSVSAGDSVRVRAITAVRLGQATLDGGVSTALGQGFFPQAATLTTAQAATADGGTRDAQMVLVNAALISDTATVNGNVRLTVSDGSGDLIVVLDQRGGFAVPGTTVPGNTFNLIGLLAPDGSGGWILKPRTPADLRRQ